MSGVQYTPAVQPGENNAGASGSSQNEKKELRDLNTRLQDYLSRTKESKSEISKLKSIISTSEVEWRKKLKDSEILHEAALRKLSEDNDQLQFQVQHHLEQLTQFKTENEDMKKRLENAEIGVNKFGQENEILRKQNIKLNQEMETLKSQYSKLEHLYKNYSSEKESLNKQIQILNDRKNELMKEKTKQTSELKAQIDYFTRANVSKKEEIDKLELQVKELQSNNQVMQNRLRSEFDEKLKDYVSKREQQYEQEKEEMMRIFKEEYNRKLQNMKESNKELQHAYKKKEEEVDLIRERISSLQKNKTELEVINRNLEEEVDKLRNDIDALRLNKEEEINKKDIKLNEIKQQYKKKEIEFDELFSLKITLTQEIDLYRKILSEAEKDAGYASPFQTNGNNINGPSRKKRKLTSGEDACYPTPGISRGNQQARQFINKDSDNNSVNDNKDNNAAGGSNTFQKKKYVDVENDETDQEDEDEEEEVIIMNGKNNTPGEAFPLQFSSMDLTNSMLEIQNISENVVCLKGFMITNKDESAKFPLPEDKYLQSNEKLKIIIGLKYKLNKINNNNEILWKADVWSGDEEDVARLYDPDHKEIARIEIHPDMLPQQKACLLM